MYINFLLIANGNKKTEISFNILDICSPHHTEEFYIESKRLIHIQFNNTSKRWYIVREIVVSPYIWPERFQFSGWIEKNTIDLETEDHIKQFLHNYYNFWELKSSLSIKYIHFKLK